MTLYLLRRRQSAHKYRQAVSKERVDNMSRQGNNTRCYTVGDMQNNTDNERNEGQAEAKPEVIKLGRNRRRAEARGRALTLSQGIIAPVGWWRPAAWKEFKTQVPEWMVSQLEPWQEEALGIDAKERQVRRPLENMVSMNLPIGVVVLAPKNLV